MNWRASEVIVISGRSITARPSRSTVTICLNVATAYFLSMNRNSKEPTTPHCTLWTKRMTSWSPRSVLTGRTAISSGICVLALETWKPSTATFVTCSSQRSTQTDVTIMKSNPAFAGAEIFQYDYLNDDVSDFGEIDYDLSNKVPPALRQAISDAREGKKGAKPILVLINPPYAESGSGAGKGDENKIGVEKTRINGWMREMNVGFASKELFAQFLIRIRHELPNAKLAMFSTLKYVNAPNFELFRRVWKAEFLSGFVVPSRSFDSLKGEFPIGFLIWDLAKKISIGDIETTVLNRDGTVIGDKAYVVRPVSTFLNAWIPWPKARGEFTVPLANALTVSANPRKKRSCRGRFGASIRGQ